MRILQVGPIPPEVGGKTGGGVAAHLWALSAHLAKQGHTVGVLGDNYYTTDLSPDPKDGIQLFGLLGLRDSLLTIYLLCPSFWLKLIRIKNHFGSLMGWKGVLAGILNYRRILKEFEPDLIHIHHLENRFPFVYYLVQDKLPIVTTVHSTSFIEFSPPSDARDRKDFILRNLNLARHLIFVSQFLEKRFVALFPGVWDDKNTYVVHNPVNGSTYYPIPKAKAREDLGLMPAGSIILFVGNLIPQKSLDILIDAAKLMQSRDLKFKVLVVGSGPQQAELEGLVERYQLGEKISFEGTKSQAELLLYYNAADLLVLPSAMESFGLVFVEALLCGCPVAGRAEVLAEILPSDRCGYILPTSDPVRWADAIADTLGRSWPKEEIRELSRVYTWEVFEDRFISIYQQMLI